MTFNNTGSITIHNALIFDGESKDLREGSIHIRDGLIVAFDDEADSADDVLDARGGVVIPGLIDAHFHAYAVSLVGIKNEVGPLSYSALVGARRLADTLDRGFTTVRDVAGGDVGLANAVHSGICAGPRYLYTAPALSQTGVKSF